jgi:hypothetical protein
MRPDMAKVVTEAPRRGSGDRNHKSRARVSVKALDLDDDFGPRKLKMSRHVRTGHGYAEGKEFSDVLGPLKKFLRKQVGRPWDTVYSELSATLDKRSISGLHIWDHVWQFVERHCEEIDGQVYRKASIWRWHLPRGTVTGLYVHPRTGLLRYAPEHYPKYRKRVNPDIIVLDAFTKLERRNSLWFRVQYGAQDRYVPPVIRQGVVIRGESWEQELVEQSKKQLSRAELKAHGLRNAA